MTSSLLGMELLLAHYRNDLKSKCDALLAHVHWKLMNEGLKCVGLGEDFGASKEISPTELLPTGWNTPQDGSFALKYRMMGQLTAKFILKVVRIMKDDPDSSVSIFLVRVADEECRSIDVEPNVVMHDDFSMADMEFFKNFDKKVLDSILPEENPSSKMTSGVSTAGPSSRPRPRPVTPERLSRRNPLIDYGRPDLDPLGRPGMGGMLFPSPRFDPHRPPGLNDPLLDLGFRRPWPNGQNFGDDFGPPGFPDFS